MHPIRVCTWVGHETEGCRCPTIYGKSYCETHYARVYTVFLPEMAEYILESDQKDVLE